jgi:hypothetical protein
MARYCTTLNSAALTCTELNCMLNDTFADLPYLVQPAATLLPPYFVQKNALRRDALRCTTLSCTEMHCAARRSNAVYCA